MFILILFLIVFHACTDKSTEGVELSLSKKLHKIEKSIDEKNIDIPKFVTPYDLNNQSFFKNISKIMLIKKKEERENMHLSKNDLDSLINNALERYRNNLTLKDINLKSEKKLTPKEELIFKSYFKSLSTSNLSKIKITNYYISQITNLNLSKESRQFSLNTLSFTRQLLISINYDNNKNLNNKIENFDDCFDGCMRGKADAVFRDGNWIDIAQFIATAAVTTAWWIGSCAWNCV